MISREEGGFIIFKISLHTCLESIRGNEKT